MSASPQTRTIKFLMNQKIISTTIKQFTGGDKIYMNEIKNDL